MKKIGIWMGFIIIGHVSIIYADPIDPYILEYRINHEFNTPFEVESLHFKEKRFSLNIQPSSQGMKIDFEEGLGTDVTGKIYSNLDLNGHILEAQAKLAIKKERFVLSTGLAHLNQTPLMKESLFGKVGFSFLPSSMFGLINHEGKINIGWMHLPDLYSRWTNGKDGTDLFGGGAMWRFHTESYKIEPDFLFKSELKMTAYLFSELPKKKDAFYPYDEDIIGAFGDFPVNYNLSFIKKLSPGCNMEMDYQGEINPSFYPYGGGLIPLSHGVISKVNLKPTDTFLLQLMAYLPISIKKISYSNPNASFMSKEISANLEFKEKHNWNHRLLLDYDYENNQVKEVTFSTSRRFNSFDSGVYYTNNNNHSSQHTVGIYLSTQKRTDYSRYDLKEYQEFPSQFFGKNQKEDMHGLKNKGFEETVAALDTPEKVASYLAQFFRYRTEGKFIPQTSRETFEKKMGDCDDQARFASFVLTQHGYEAYVLTYFGRRVAHGISVYKDHNGKWNSIEYGKIFYAQAENPEELITRIEPGMLRYILFKPNDSYEVKSYVQSQTLEKIINWFWAD